MAEFKGASSEAGRAMAIVKKREEEKESFERQKEKISRENEKSVRDIGQKFASTYDNVGDLLIKNTVGLVTRDEFTKKREQLLHERELQIAKAAADSENKKSLESKKKKKKKKKAAGLSFDLDEEEGDGCEDKELAHVSKKAKKSMKNPTVDTSFLPDKNREEEERILREQLKEEWSQKQEEIKAEDIEITYSYWDGSGHRYSIKVKKGDTIGKFLQKCLESLRKDFSELRVVGVDNIMYIKEDLIIPQHFTFYDFIVTKARGKSGPLFSFDVHEDVRLLADARVEKDESHAGKVCLRSWYERNKHIFPASRWEPYDPQKSFDKYTIK
eukprot:Nk52_evm19s156 gene=Nk52_evmTU19s156